ncbi:DnaJ C-terminal domain-containing protein [Ancylobacter lacus]|uniref:DnaJ C-terminal domain-containing protein n=1 Tax=Ancylobacter lacus TaxID=2579970 RepID=UPI001BCB50F0|nr:DnaJ C-terminal domain-containing protein [Ancylobacter lacus]MBS7540499.1 J domain-containing protein [Ancylobacter lacus]
MREPYDVLGVARNASQDDIKRAFRRLAKKLHPDANASDPKAQEKFAELNSAHEILSDPDTRGKYDRGEIDAEGKPRGFDPYAGRPGGFRRGPGGAGGETIFENFHFDDGAARRGPQAGPQGGPQGGGFEDVFSDLFGRFGRGGGGRAGAGGAPKGGDIDIAVPVPLERVVEGGPVKVTLPNGRTVEVKIPAGVAEGYRLRLKGQGEPSPYGGAPGDAYVVVGYAPHRQFRVEGSDLRLDLPVPLADAVLGGKVRVPTLSGSVELAVPAWTQNGRTFRLRGKGLPKGEGVSGDLLATARIALPDQHDPELEALMRKRRDGAG